MKLSLSLLTAALCSLSLVAGCATDTDDASDEDAIVGATEESDLTITPTRQAQLDALRARVTGEFAHPTSLHGKKLVFVVKTYHSNSNYCFIQAHVMKRDTATGKDSELTSADYKGSWMEKAIKEGFFDGPEALTLLVKNGSKWAVAKHGSQEAFAFGPTDAADAPWADQYGLPHAWFR